ncbi:MAG: NAD(P)H-hydrate epimerase, partial [Clostridiales bacterium]|nr:NAD(P)H-hydrate epimerase [Clostridiales bacterium]
MKLVTSNQIAEIDRKAIEEFDIPSTLLMENAGRKMAEHMGHLSGKNIVVISGRGKNGGDGFVVARLAILQNAQTVNVIIPDGKDMAPDTSEMKRRYVEVGGNVINVVEINEEIKTVYNNADIIVDALFGTGLSREPSG